MHDGNTRFVGGVSGHAGLFCGIFEVFKLLEQFGVRSELIKPSTLLELLRNHTPGLNQHRAFGWQLASSPGSSAGSALSPDAFGHTGFTGTSVWFDPDYDRAFILLTNRTHPRDTGVDLNPIRREFHRLAVEALE